MKLCKIQVNVLIPVSLRKHGDLLFARALSLHLERPGTRLQKSAGFTTLSTAVQRCLGAEENPEPFIRYPVLLYTPRRDSGASE